MIERLVRYSILTSTVEQEFERHEWYFLIINEPKEIRNIRERIFKQLEPINLDKELKGTIKNSRGLHYDYFRLTSQKGKFENPDKVYYSKKFKQDRALYKRDEQSLINYLTSLEQGRK